MACEDGAGSGWRIDEDVIVEALARAFNFVLFCAVLIICCFGATDLITAPEGTGKPEGVRIGGG